MDNLSRLASYVNWPMRLGLYPYPSELAENGFYYTGQGDEVTCFRCGVVLGNWQSGENPHERHRQTSANCVLVRVSTIATTSNTQSNSIRMKSEAARLATFAAWPKTRIVAPRLLAFEGFFYVGPNDRVRCAFCDGELENWEEGDDPVREHGRFFNHCPFFQRRLDVGNEPIGNRDQQHHSSVRKVPSSSGSKPCSGSPACAAQQVQPAEQGGNQRCSICLTDDINVAFVPCGHACACGKCAGKVNKCPMCRSVIDNRLRIFHA